jgi:hypothetical protein
MTIVEPAGLAEFKQRRNGIDKRLIVGLALARRDSHRLPMRFRDSATNSGARTSGTQI